MKLCNCEYVMKSMFIDKQLQKNGATTATASLLDTKPTVPCRRTVV